MRMQEAGTLCITVRVSGCSLLAASDAPETNAGLLAIVPTGFAPPDTDNRTEHLCPSDTVGGAPTVTSAAGANCSRFVLAGWIPYDSESESTVKRVIWQNCPAGLLKNGAPVTAQTHTQNCNTLHLFENLSEHRLKCHSCMTALIQKKHSSHHMLRPHSSMVLCPLTVRACST
jgi:hypothetical protein